MPPTLLFVVHFSYKSRGQKLRSFNNFICYNRHDNCMTTGDRKIRVILVDDHPAIHLEIGALLRTFEDIELVAQAEDGEQAVLLCDRHQPDVVLMDIAMPVLNGIDAAKAILQRHPQVRIIALTGLEDTDIIRDMLNAGAVGYLLKEAQPAELASVIRAAYDGKAVFSSEVIKPLLDSQLPQPPVSARHEYGLTRREMEILRYMVDGKTNPEIAEALMVSLATVKFHASNIFRKLGVTTRAAAVALAARQKLIR